MAEGSRDCRADARGERKAKVPSARVCTRCGKPIDDEDEDRYSDEGEILCFWCAYVESQG